MEQCASGPDGLKSLLARTDLYLATGPWVCSLEAPPELADDAVNQAADSFEGTVGQDGIGPGLRTYARTGDFAFYREAQAPIGLADTNRYFTDHPIQGTFHENSRARSTDGSLAFRAGGFTDLKHGTSHVYLQIWQYEPRVANWGLRVLSISSLV